MKIITAAVFLLVLMITIKASGQVYEVPKNYRLRSNDDYAKYEPDIIKIADWIQQTPWTADPKKSDEAIQFFLDWIRGTPAVTVNLSQQVNLLSDKNPQLGFTYMSQFSKYALQHKEKFDHTKANVEALRAVIAKYNMEPSHKKDEDVEFLVDLDKKGQLEQWIITDFEQSQ